MFPERLVAGYRNFLGERLPREQARYAELAREGQSPDVMVIGCCDSRVSPEVIFDAGRANSSSSAMSRISFRHSRRTGSFTAHRPHWNMRSRRCG